MESNDNLEGIETLLELGFTLTQISQLNRLRASYAEKEREQLLVEQRRLEFARWLVSTGRLTDELPAKTRAGRVRTPRTTKEDSAYTLGQRSLP